VPRKKPKRGESSVPGKLVETQHLYNSEMGKKGERGAKRERKRQTKWTLPDKGSWKKRSRSQKGPLPKKKKSSAEKKKIWGLSWDRVQKKVAQGGGKRPGGEEKRGGGKQSEENRPGRERGWSRRKKKNLRGGKKRNDL